MRRLKSWLDGFISYTDGLPSSRMFRWWAGAVCVSGALERKNSTFISDKYVYPNLYVLFVGPPASGKTIAIDEAKTILREVNGIRLGPDDATEAALYDRLQKALKTTVRPALPPLQHHSLTTLIGEFGTLLTPGDIRLCNALTSLFDCPEVFDKGRRVTEDNFIERCFLTLLGGTTASSLGELFTPRILEQGLPSRFILVYSDKVTERPPLFRDEREQMERERKRQELRSHLIADLKEINEMNGPFFWSDEAAQLMIDWHQNEMAPKVEDTRFTYYNDRRLVHFTKLLMVISASSRGDYIIEAEDFNIGRKMFLETETSMPQALQYSASNQFYNELVRLVVFVHTEFGRTKRGVPEWKLRKLVSRNVPFQMIDATIEALVNQRELGASGTPGNRVFTPLVKTPEA
jgi:hypothetical protein